jgi:putative secretion ATPase (PEP-CTERM system associated)
MYERFYHLRERPFLLSPDPDYLYLSPGHREALSFLRYGIEGHAGFVVVTGEIGCGKTTVLQTVLRGLDRQTSVSRLVNTTLDPRDLIEAVMLDFGLQPAHGQSKPYLIRELARYLEDQHTAGRPALLVIDEAQNLSLAALEEIRMLSNLETEKSKLIQVILVGQSSLRDALGQPELEQLRQRVTVSYHLEALDAAETAAYINHRLGKASIGAPLVFSREVTDLIHLHSEGVPRKINVIADAVLLFGYGEDQRAIDLDLTRETLRELEATGVIAAPSAGVVAEADDRLVALQIREERVAERERELDEQRRVLMTEYRLLHEQRTPTAQAVTSPARTTAGRLPRDEPGRSGERPASSPGADPAQEPSASQPHVESAPAASPGGERDGGDAYSGRHGDAPPL